MCRACCLGARAWPLGRPPPGGELTIVPTMARAFSSGTPLPLMGKVRPIYVPVLFAGPFLPPPPCFVYRWGASTGLGRLPPISCIRPRMKGVRSCLGGALPLPLLVGGPPPSLSCMPCVRSTRCLWGAPPSTSWSGVPPLPSPASRAGREHVAWGVPPPSPSWSGVPHPT